MCFTPFNVSKRFFALFHSENVREFEKINFNYEDKLKM